ncbi:hypothetical protein TrVGV298_002120 [Trichoderma virens]|nr:hypothetical protein TrVGV298_002120 [Trichoderma virens]
MIHPVRPAGNGATKEKGGYYEDVDPRFDQTSHTTPPLPHLQQVSYEATNLFGVWAVLTSQTTPSMRPPEPPSARIKTIRKCARDTAGVYPKQPLIISSSNWRGAAAGKWWPPGFLEDMAAKVWMTYRSAVCRYLLYITYTNGKCIWASMRYLDFVASLGRLFNRSHGQRVKTAFCQIINLLLLGIASKASNSHLMHPKWMEVVATIGPRLAQMFTKLSRFRSRPQCSVFLRLATSEPSGYS